MVSFFFHAALHGDDERWSFTTWNGAHLADVGAFANGCSMSFYVVHNVMDQIH